MAVPHFFVAALGVGPVLLSAEDSRHATRSLRLRPGEGVSLADGAGLVAAGVVRGERDGRAEIEVRSVARVQRPRPVLEVAVAPPKGDRLSWAVQKLAELGVDRVRLLRTERSVRAWDDGRAGRVAERLGAVAREAAMQARRPFVTRVLPPEGLAEPLAGEGVVMLWEEAERPLASVLPERPETVRLVVGPEGGLSPAEVEEAVRRGVPLASLGPGVLRTETAAVVGAALALAHYGRLG